MHIARIRLRVSDNLPRKEQGCMYVWHWASRAAKYAALMQGSQAHLDNRSKPDAIVGLKRACSEGCVRLIAQEK